MTEEAQKTIIRPNTEGYKSAVSASGAKTLNNGDNVASALEGANLDEVKTIAAGMGFEDVNKYDHLNIGQRRMNLGNAIRGTVRRMNKESDGSGDELLAEVIKPVRVAIDKRLKEVNEAKAKQAEAKAAKPKTANDAKPKTAKKASKAA